MTTSTYQHSVNVGVYAITPVAELFGDRLSPMDIIKLAKGYFLHDIGMTQIDREILNKSTPLTRLEQLEIRHHPSRGFAMLEESGHLSSEAADIVRINTSASTAAATWWARRAMRFRSTPRSAPSPTSSRP